MSEEYTPSQRSLKENIEEFELKIEKKPEVIPNHSKFRNISHASKKTMQSKEIIIEESNSPENLRSRQFSID